MIKVSLDKGKLSKALDNIEKYSQDVQKRVAVEIAKSTLRVESNAKRFAPVDTGRLRASIASNIKPDRGEVGTNVEYAPFMEFGTYKSAGKPFLFPAWNMERSKFIASLKIALKK